MSSRRGALPGKYVNGYYYAASNPITLYDPNGQDIEEESGDPRKSPRYIENLKGLTAEPDIVSGRVIFEWTEDGKKKIIRIPQKRLGLVLDDKSTFLGILKVHKSYEEAMKAVNRFKKRATKAGAEGFEYYSYYRGPQGVILPTSFSIGSTPNFRAIWPAVLERAEEDARRGFETFRSLPAMLNPFPGTRVDESGNLVLSGNPVDYLSLLKLRNLRRLNVSPLGYWMGRTGSIKLRKLSHGNPDFNINEYSFFDHPIPEGANWTRVAHARPAAKALKALIIREGGYSSASVRQWFSPAQIKNLKKALGPTRTPEIITPHIKSFVWHHSADDVRMLQLLDKKLHQANPHIGGFALGK